MRIVRFSLTLRGEGFVVGIIKETWFRNSGESGGAFQLKSKTENRNCVRILRPLYYCNF